MVLQHSHTLLLPDDSLSILQAMDLSSACHERLIRFSIHGACPFSTVTAGCVFSLAMRPDFRHNGGKLIREDTAVITLQDVLDARSRTAPYILHTPLLRAPALDPVLGYETWLKFEGCHEIGSFKIRGAMNRALSLTPEELSRGLAAASSGNHAQGVAMAARRLGTRAVIVMPVDVSPVKLDGVKALGAETELVGTLSSQREARARELAAARGMTFIHPFADPWVAAGQGTIGLEILEDLPSVDAVAVPVGGGGLLSGVATAVKGMRPEVKVIGVEPAGAARYSASRAAGKPVKLDRISTIADGTRTDAASPVSFEVIQARAVALCTADDLFIRKAMKLLLMKAHIAVEPSAALPVAAALAGTLPAEKGSKVVFVLTGSNVDPSLLAEILAEPD